MSSAALSIARARTEFRKYRLNYIQQPSVQPVVRANFLHNNQKFKETAPLNFKVNKCMSEGIKHSRPIFYTREDCQEVTTTNSLITLRGIAQREQLQTPQIRAIPQSIVMANIYTSCLLSLH